MPIDRRKLPKIQRIKLGRQKAWGLARSRDFNEPVDHPTIVVDERLTGRKELEVFTHEALHLICPGLLEEDVLAAGRYISQVLWHVGYRKT